MSIKQKTINGLLWSFVDRFASQFITFIVGIVLARLLSPKEFGLIGMLTIFIGISSVFIQSGLNQALIRKTDCTEKDYSTVFYFNLCVSVLFYVALYISSGLISSFYDEAQLNSLIKVLGIILIINALTIVQRTKITKQVDFKLLTKISLFSSVGSGLVGITMAATGFGVWSLVYRQITQKVLEGSFLWYWNNWLPREKFSKESFKNLFRFSSNLLSLGIIDIIYKNIYHVIIGKFYPVANLGFYTKAFQLKTLPSETLGSVIDRVSFPIMSSIQKHKEEYNNLFKRLLKSTMLISFVLFTGFAAIAEEFTIILMGENWAVTGSYLQVLCFAAMFYPLDKLLSSLIKVEGRSDLILKLGIARKFFAIPVIFTAIFLGIKPMLYVMIGEQVASMVLMSAFASRYAGMNVFKLIRDISFSLISSLMMFLVLFFLGYIVTLPLMLMLISKILLGVIIIIVFFEVTKFNDYIYLKKEVISKLKSRKNNIY